MKTIITARKRSLVQGNIFTPVCHSVHGGCYPSMPCRWYPSMPCRGVSDPGVVPTPGDACSGGLLLPGGAWWRPPPTATAASGTHPTGMHSCYWFSSEPSGCQSGSGTTAGSVEDQGFVWEAKVSYQLLFFCLYLVEKRLTDWFKLHTLNLLHVVFS